MFGIVQWIKNSRWLYFCVWCRNVNVQVSEGDISLEKVFSQCMLKYIELPIIKNLCEGSGWWIIYLQVWFTLKYFTLVIEIFISILLFLICLLSLWVDIHSNGLVTVDWEEYKKWYTGTKWVLMVVIQSNLLSKVTTCLQRPRLLFPVKMVSHWSMY